MAGTIPFTPSHQSVHRHGEGESGYGSGDFRLRHLADHAQALQQGELPLLQTGQQQNDRNQNDRHGIFRIPEREPTKRDTQCDGDRHAQQTGTPDPPPENPDGPSYPLSVARRIRRRNVFDRAEMYAQSRRVADHVDNTLQQAEHADAGRPQQQGDDLGLDDRNQDREKLRAPDDSGRLERLFVRGVCAGRVFCHSLLHDMSLGPIPKASLSAIRKRNIL